VLIALFPQNRKGYIFNLALWIGMCALSDATKPVDCAQIDKELKSSGRAFSSGRLFINHRRWSALIYQIR
jgi:hypothetical protein